MMSGREGTGGVVAAVPSRKQKKKQAKEEQDRLKQAEKKKRRLEKALANAAAIRSELEKKKQKRKEEEKRLDEEGAALAEAVALQVLVDEECGDDGERKEIGLYINPKCSEKVMLIGIADSAGDTNPKAESLWGSFWQPSDPVPGAGLGSRESVMDWHESEYYMMACGSIVERVRRSNAAAGAAGVAVGSAAVQAVAALHIAEETRGEAEAYKTVAKAQLL